MPHTHPRAPTSRRTTCCRRLLGTALLTLVSAAPAGDWPQWRFDANRSAATDESCATELQPLWSLSLPRPDPAYDHQYRMCADAAYAPVAADAMLFIPSNVADCVIACDLGTGTVRWRCFAEGPVRFAPAYWNETVCFGADDGFLHGVSARDGRPRWKVRGAPESLPDSRMLVNGRMCSRWPVRGAPAVHEGVVFFGAGIWPEEGVYVCAVQVDTGKLLWRRDSMSLVKDGMSDHGKPYDLSLPPQGYLAVIDGKLAVPSGRSLAAWFDPGTGTMEPYTSFYVKTSPPRGTWYLAGVGRYCVQGGNWFGTRADAAPPMGADMKDTEPAVVWSRQPPANELSVARNRPFLRADTYRLHNENLYTEPVLTRTVSYASEFAEETRYLVPRGHTHLTFPAHDRIVARDLTAPRWSHTVQPDFRYGGRKTKLQKLVFPVLWQLESPLRVLIKAGDHLYAGGENVVAAVAIPAAGEAARIAWQAPVDGTPVHALVADGRLVVATDTGTVACFGTAGRASAPAAVASAAAGEASVPRAGGFAWLLGWGDGSLAGELAREDGRRVVVSEPDVQKAGEARRSLAREGLYGRTVQVITGTPTDASFTPYWAERVVVVSPDALGTPQSGLAAALDALRPYTGTLVLSPSARQVDDVLERLLSGRGGYALERTAESVTVRRRAPPSGSGSWTHESGGPDNRFANSEALVKWPLGVLWYSGDVDRYFTPPSHFQHERHPYPLVIGGRMFVITGQFLHAIDIYTGSYFWKAEMPLTPWVQTRFFDSRVYGRPTERNCVVAPDRVYAVTGEKVHAYDVATGEPAGVLEIPAQLREQANTALHETRERRYHGHRAKVQAVPQWTEVRLWDDLLIAMLGPSLAGVDRHTGTLRWVRATTRQTTTYAVGGNTLFGLDCDVPAMEGGGGGTASGLLFAMDPADARILWQTRVDYPPVPAHKPDNPRSWLPPVMPVLSHNSKHGLLVMAVNRADIHVFRANDGTPVWSKAGAAAGNLQRIYPPTVTDDYLVLSNYKGCFGYLLDIVSGREAGDNTGIPRPRTCARIIGNNSLLVYRDAATELYDIVGNRMIGLNSVRAGCTTSFIPAGGVMTAPMLGHGCVCNYPMFASLGLYHWPAIDQVRPAAVKGSWVNQADELIAASAAATAADPFMSGAGGTVDLKAFALTNAVLEPSGGAALLRTKDKNAGYALQASATPLQRATFRLSLKRATGNQAVGRHGNAFFVCGGTPDQLIECRLYYGGRSSLMITGPRVEHVEKKVAFTRRTSFTVEVTVDCNAGTVAFSTDGKEVTSRIAPPLSAITHYGYGGANSDNLFTAITVE